MFHAQRARATRFRVSYRWIDVAIGRGRAELETLEDSPPVRFSAGSVSSLKGTCREGQTLIVDSKGVRTAD